MPQCENQTLPPFPRDQWGGLLKVTLVSTEEASSAQLSRELPDTGTWRDHHSSVLLTGCQAVF